MQSEEDSPVAQQKAAKKQKTKKEPAKKRQRDQQPLNPNVMKAQNKLVGNITQNDLYDSDADRHVTVVDEPTG